MLSVPTVGPSKKQTIPLITIAFTLPFRRPLFSSPSRRASKSNSS
jgi:hypothetical protein